MPPIDEQLKKILNGMKDISNSIEGGVIAHNRKGRLVAASDGIDADANRVAAMLPDFIGIAENTSDTLLKDAPLAITIQTKVAYILVYLITHDHSLAVVAKSKIGLGLVDLKIYDLDDPENPKTILNQIREVFI